MNKTVGMYDFLRKRNSSNDREDLKMEVSRLVDFERSNKFASESTIICPSLKLLKSFANMRTQAGGVSTVYSVVCVTLILL